MSAPQGTEAWRLERCGFATASRFADVMAKIKTGEAVSRRDYRNQLICERLTGIPVDSYQNADMLRGIELEPQAREAYEAETGVLVMQTGFLKHPDIPWCGASPDGLLDDDGAIELKCPKATTHLTYLQGGVCPSEYRAQVQGQMWVTGRKWVDFCSYDPRFPLHLQLFVLRVPRDEEYIATLAGEVKKFLAECEALYQSLAQRSKAAA